MINCLSFSPLFLSFYLPIVPLNTLFLSILYPLITIFFLNFLFFSSLPDLPSASSYSCPCPASLMTLFFSLSFVLCSIFLLPSSSWIWLSSPLPSPHLLFCLCCPSPTFSSTGPEHILDASSTVCYATYGMYLNQPLLSFSCHVSSFHSSCIFSIFPYTFQVLIFYLTFPLVTPVCMPLSECSLHAR